PSRSCTGTYTYTTLGEETEQGPGNCTRALSFYLESDTLATEVANRVREYSYGELVRAVTDLEVQVRTAGVSSGAYPTNHLSGCHGLTLAYVVACKVSVKRVLAVGELDNHVVTVSSPSESVSSVY